MKFVTQDGWPPPAYFQPTIFDEDAFQKDESFFSKKYSFFIKLFIFSIFKNFLIFRSSGGK